jgi:DNA-binding MarR family transcriptional regulator
MVDRVARARRKLAQEIAQGRPFRSRGHEAVVALLRTADVVRRFLGGVFQPHGITLQQYNVLRILRGAGPAGLPTLEIASRMIEPTPGITRLLDRLAAKRMVRRYSGQDDRRLVVCRITHLGLQILAGLDQAVDRADVAAFRGLDSRGLTRLIDALERVRAGHS